MVREENKIVSQAQLFYGNLWASSVPSKRWTSRVFPVSQISGYKANQTVTFKFNKAYYLDVQSSYIRYTLKLSDTQDNVAFLSSYNLIQRLVVRDGSTVLEDINDYHILANMFRRSLVTQDHAKANSILYGTSEYEDFNGVYEANSGNGASVNNQSFVLTLDLSGLFGSNVKYLPLQHMNDVYVEITFASNEDVLIHKGAQNNKSYTLDDVMYIADYVEFNEEFERQFKELLSQTPLELYYHTYSSHTSAVAGTNHSVIVTEKASSIKDVYWVIIKNSNRTSHNLNTMQFSSLASNNNNLSIFVQLGGHVYPSQRMESVCEVYSELKKSFNTLLDISQTGLVDRDQFTTGVAASGTQGSEENGICVSFMMGLNMETHLQASVDGTLVLSGKNSMSTNQNLTIYMNNTPFLDVSTCYAFIHADRILSIDQFGKSTVSY